MGNNAVFQNVRSVGVKRSLFDLSYTKTLTCDMGQLIPVLCEEMVPGDYFEVGNQSVVRMQPLVAPVLHEINIYTHYFFVPYRLLWTGDSGWTDFITRGSSGNDAPTLPRWSPTLNGKGTLWDYLGFPVGVVPTGALPMAFPRDAYNLVYNEYYRDETLIAPVALTQEAILNRCWEKDYLTSSLLTQQRGIAPALPISGTTSAVFDAASFNPTGYANGVSSNTTVPKLGFASAADAAQAKAALDNNTVDLSIASTFNIATLRVAFQIQKWLERNNRAGVRYTEFLKAHFSVSPRDERLQRPEYIGGSKSPVVVSEVLQTSVTASTPQGNMAGHGISANSSFCGKYHAKEYGLIIGIMSVMPRAMYQQGINRQWLRTTCYDFYFPEFANLSEQAVIQAEVYANGVSNDNNTLFGYQGRYNEMRSKNNMVCGDMRDTYAYWHLGRQFSSVPVLNETFVKCIPRKDIFAAPSAPGLIVSFGNIVRAFRPMPIQPEPGLIDHH